MQRNSGKAEPAEKAGLAGESGKPEVTGKAEDAEESGKAEVTGKAEDAETSGKSEPEENAGLAEESGKAEPAEKTGRAKRSRKSAKAVKAEKSEHMSEPDRSEKSQKSDKAKTQNAGNEKPDLTEEQSGQMTAMMDLKEEMSENPQSVSNATGQSEAASKVWTGSECRESNFKDIVCLHQQGKSGGFSQCTGCASRRGRRQAAVSGTEDECRVCVLLVRTSGLWLKRKV